MAPLTDTLSGDWMPWGEKAAELTANLRKTILFDSFGAGLLHEDRTALDELLAAEGECADPASTWRQRQFGPKGPVAEAIQRGGVSMTLNVPAQKGAQAVKEHVLMVVAPESVLAKRGWWLLLSRREKPFESRDVQWAELLLQSWRARFNQADESGMGRLLIGHDQRLIHADPCTARLLLEHHCAFEKFNELLHDVIAQRWPKLTDGKVGDCALELAGRPYWVRFVRRRALNLLEAVHWRLELRSLTKGELPIVGLVEDDRVARAIAYLHDHFQESPNLTDIAHAIHVSPFHFHRMFSQQVGVSPKYYLQSKQLQIARWLVRSTRRPIGEVASRAGFASHGHFTSTFHRVVGVSPSEYREQS